FAGLFESKTRQLCELSSLGNVTGQLLLPDWRNVSTTFPPGPLGTPRASPLTD
ncbi:unnamed protein product, partial [Ectocarpus sp. 13 AM-2016]